MSCEDMSKKEDSSNAAKHLARLTAVQALYEASFEEEPLDDIIKRIALQAGGHLNDEDDPESHIELQPDAALLRRITEGVVAAQESLDEMVRGSLDERFAEKKMERLLHYILLAGAYELHAHSDIDAGIIISDYIDVARAFYSSKEPGLVNAVLDKLAKRLRS
jgi:N utilization substance protein B